MGEAHEISRLNNGGVWPHAG